MNTWAPWTAGNTRKVSNYGRWEAVITTPTGNVAKAYGEEKAAVSAHARLIAEAPAMLEALQDVQELIRLADRTAHGREQREADEAKCLKRIDAILARVDGR